MPEARRIARSDGAGRAAKLARCFPTPDFSARWCWRMGLLTAPPSRFHRTVFPSLPASGATSRIKGNRDDGRCHLPFHAPNITGFPMPVPTKMADLSATAASIPRRWMPSAHSWTTTCGRSSRSCARRNPNDTPALPRPWTPPFSGVDHDQRHDDDQFVGDRVRWLLQRSCLPRHHAVDRLS